MEQSKEKTVAKKKKTAKGLVFISIDLCKGCGFCVEFCPFGVLEMSNGFNKKGYHPAEAINPEACTGCDLCGMYCPDFAIHGRKLTKEEKEEREG